MKASTLAGFIRASLFLHSMRRKSRFMKKLEKWDVRNIMERNDEVMI